MCKNIQFLILLDLFVAFVFPNFTVFSQDSVDVERSEKLKFPHLAAVGYSNIDSKAPITINGWWCSGSLISSRHVLLPADCVESKESERLYVILGSNDPVGNKSYSQVIGVDSIVIHPLYKDESSNHNLAMLTLKSEANITDYVAPIQLHTEPMNSTILQNQVFTTVALTHIITLNEEHPEFVALPVSIVSEMECNEDTRLMSFPELESGIGNTAICVKVINPEDCKGFGWGLLIMSNKDAPSVHVLVGVGILGVDCDVSIPDVYILVYPYLSWINEFISKKSYSTLD